MSLDRVLVTGATGFVGRHLVDRLLDLGSEVILLRRSTSPNDHPWGARVREIRTTEDGGEYLGSRTRELGVTAVLHLAAYGVNPILRDVDSMLRANVAMPLALVRVAAEARCPMIMTGSSAEYAPPAGQGLTTEAATLEAVRLYGATKAAGGLATMAVASTLGVPFRLLRLFNVYGAYEAPHRLMPSLLRGLANGTPIALSDGMQVRDFVHVDDVVYAILQAASHPVDMKTPVTAMNICSSVATTVRSFALSVCEAVGAPASLLHFGVIPRRVDDLEWLVGDGQLAAQTMGFRPAISLQDGIRRTVAQRAFQRSSAP